MIDAHRLQQFESRLRQDIPLVEHLGFQAFDFDGDQLTIGALLAPNVNDKGTGFAGSISAASTLCGWSAITLLLSDEDRAYDVVIRSSELEYFLPVTRDFRVTATLPKPAERAVFLARLREKGRARIDLCVEIHEAETLVFRLRGAYVALEKKQWV